MKIGKNLIDKLTNRAGEFAEKARKKGYREEDIEMLALLSITTLAVEKFGDIEKPIDFLISLVDKCDTSQEAFDKFTDKLGLD